MWMANCQNVIWYDVKEDDEKPQSKRAIFLTMTFHWRFRRPFTASQTVWLWTWRAQRHLPSKKSWKSVNLLKETIDHTSYPTFLLIQTSFEDFFLFAKVEGKASSETSTSGTKCKNANFSFSTQFPLDFWCNLDKSRNSDV